MAFGRVRYDVATGKVTILSAKRYGGQRRIVAEYDALKFLALLTLQVPPKPRTRKKLAASPRASPAVFAVVAFFTLWALGALASGVYLALRRVAVEVSPEGLTRLELGWLKSFILHVLASNAGVPAIEKAPAENGATEAPRPSKI